MKAMKKLLALVLAMAMIFSLAATPVFAAVSGYNDVPADEWYVEAVQYVTENGLMNGMADGVFGPNGTSTRAMVVTILHRMEGTPEPTKADSFTDLDRENGKWYLDAVAWASETGIVKGISDTTFEPDTEITREQLATMMYRYVGVTKGHDGSVAGDLSVFPDDDKVSDWAMDAMVWAVGVGLINGIPNYADNTVELQPQGNATRAQLAAILMRLSEDVIAHKHTLVHYEAVEPTCHGLGNIEYWYCPDCDAYFQDEACTQLTNSKRVILPATGSENVEHYEAVASNCHMAGNIEYWYCPDCDTYYQDEACTQVTNSKNVIIPAETDMVYTAEVPATCFENGVSEYWYCEKCDVFTTDPYGRNPIAYLSLTIPGGHDLVHVDAVAPGCHSNGNVEHWYCNECETVWTDEALTQISNHLSVVIPAYGSENVEHHEAVASNCHMAGNIEYWYCANCDTYFQDEACTQVTNSKNVIIPAETDMVYTAEVPATCFENGVSEYWYCEKCDVFTTDPYGRNPIAYLSLTIPAEHTYGDDNICDVCEMAKPGTDASNPIILVPEEIQMPGGILNGAQITVPAGETVYYAARVSNVKVGLTGAWDVSVTVDEVVYNSSMWGEISIAVPEYTGMPPVPVTVLAITNSNDYDFENYITIEELVFGTYDNPAELNIGENTAIGGGNGYFFTWTATEAGTLALEMPTDMGWTFFMNNMTTYVYGDTQWSDSEPVVNTVEVAAGDEIQIMVNTYDPENPWAAPEANVVFTASFTAAE